MLLKTVNAPDSGDTFERMLNDHVHGGVSVAPPGLWRKLPLESSARPVRSRSKLWDLSAMLHCSIIGTCLTIGDLRSLVGGADRKNATDHDLHTIAVASACK